MNSPSIHILFSLRCCAVVEDIRVDPKLTRFWKELSYFCFLPFGMNLVSKIWIHKTKRVKSCEQPQPTWDKPASLAELLCPLCPCLAFRCSKAVPSVRFLFCGIVFDKETRVCCRSFSTLCDAWALVLTATCPWAVQHGDSSPALLWFCLPGITSLQNSSSDRLTTVWCRWCGDNLMKAWVWPFLSVCISVRQASS